MYVIKGVNGRADVNHLAATYMGSRLKAVKHGHAERVSCPAVIVFNGRSVALGLVPSPDVAGGVLQGTLILRLV